MQPHCKRESQFELFEATTPAAEPAPKIALPFQRSAEIDVKRAGMILGVTDNTVRTMIRAGCFRSYPGIGGLRILYSSLVEYCERLRLEYHISDRMVPAPKAGRLRDRDLLPFPLDETIYVKEVTERLDCSVQAVIKRIEEGVFIAYKVTLRGEGCAWRIYRRSFDRYVESMNAAATTQTLRTASSRR